MACRGTALLFNGLLIYTRLGHSSLLEQTCFINAFSLFSQSYFNVTISDLMLSFHVVLAKVGTKWDSAAAAYRI
jgi:hypothetical protein